MKYLALVQALAVVALAVCTTTSAQADDAYVCDGGRLVYARPETLEKLKQSDPCIAGYFKFQSAPIAVPAEPPAAASAEPAPLRGDDRPSLRQPKGRSASLAVPIEKTKAPEVAIGTDYRNVRVINADAESAAIFRHNH